MGRYTTTATGEILGVTRITLLEWVKDGLFPKNAYFKRGNRTYFKKTFIDKVAQDENNKYRYLYKK